MPRSPEPQSTSRPSSVITRVSVRELERRRRRPRRRHVVVLDAMPIASDEPSASTRIRRSLWRSSPSLVSFDHITPDEMITRSDEMSQRSGSASRARRIGLAKASPTIVIDFTRSCFDGVEQLDRVEAGGRQRDDRPAGRQRRQRVEQAGAVHQRGRRAGCAGRACRCARVERRRRRRRAAGAVRSTARALRIEVVLAPHHALGHAGRAAGVEQQEVVAASAPTGATVRPGHDGRDVLVRRRPVRARPGAVVDPQPGRDRRAAGRAPRRTVRRTRRGTRRPRRRRCPTGTSARRRCTDSSC